MAGERTTDERPATGFRLRRDVQGLRALAVGIVVVNHLFGDVLPGGFVGVDVFLVVSGYLITALMLREVDRTGTLSLRSFYARRARRILPAATLVLVLTALASVFVLPLLRARAVLEDAFWSTLFLGNVRMAQVGSDYFAEDSPASPLRHYWSLAVEEQFYLVWPLVLLACVVWAARRQSSVAVRMRRVAVGLLGVAVLASVTWSWWATEHSPTTAYYSTFTRTHELAIGALLAFVPVTLGLTRRARELLVWAGLTAIAVSAFLFDSSTSFPGVWALVPTLGAVAVLLAGVEREDASGSRLLGVAPAVRLGDWSYSLYLWHWPVILLVAASLDEEHWTLPVKTTVLVACLLISWASYEWVENPFRRARPFRSVRGGLVVYPVSVALALAVVVGSGAVVDHRLAKPGGGAPVTLADRPAVTEGTVVEDDVDRVAALVQATVLEAGEGRGITGTLTPSLVNLESSVADLGECDYVQGMRRLCPAGDVDSDRDVVVLGDSLARAMSPGVVRMGRDHGLRVHVLGYAGCPATTLVQPARGSSRPWEACEDFKAWARSVIADLRPEIVLVATSANRVLDPKTGAVVKESDPRYLSLAKTGWRDLVTDLRRDAQRVAVFANTPRLPERPADCLTDGSPTLADCTFTPDEKVASQAATLMAAGREAGAQVVDAAQWFCFGGRCPMVVGEYVTLRDTHHMTPQYAEQIAVPLARELGLASSARAAG
ncbi:acyltransferase family protein [Nocardioides yefusunii]|uniref:Acyltransferase family protein n=1 Tax=Nocardioides yefusunii TaxID=2500546 RepID=A0ABW1R059_9ACTN|nr:acyltransferase family protein [Nocardioides yefusunii]